MPIINNSPTPTLTNQVNIPKYKMKLRSVFIFLILITLAWIIWDKAGYQVAAKIGLLSYETDAWYAVHLEDGNVFFGHIDRFSNSTIILDQAYFLESFEPSKESQKSLGESMQVESVPQKLYNLTERGTDKFFNTDHKIYINRDNVLFWEKLTTDSEIVKTIKKQK